MLARSIAQAGRAEEYIARFAGLSRMTSAELTQIFGGGPAEIEPWLRAAAVHDVVEAQVRLGQMLLDGAGIPKDEQSALRWFLRAARAGDAEAMNMVGRCHENGWGTTANDYAAMPWYRRSAEAEHDWGEYNYAHMLFDGRGGAPCDRIAAFGYYLRAAGKGHARAMNLVARCFEVGWGIAPDPLQAAIWYERSARAGYFRAQYNYALILIERGDYANASIWLKHAGREGDGAWGKKITALLEQLRNPGTL